jgi:hypothetical protein
MRLAELEDLHTIAAGWNVPAATAAWALLHDQLARCRGQSPELGEHGLAIAAGLRVLRERGRRETEPDGEVSADG